MSIRRGLAGALEANEDFIIAVVENLQIGRKTDAFTHFDAQVELGQTCQGGRPVPG